jgi:hypothetical protein
MYRSGIQSIDRGQTEAGIAMGFTRFQTFSFIVTPQAVRRIPARVQGRDDLAVKEDLHCGLHLPWKTSPPPATSSRRPHLRCLLPAGDGGSALLRHLVAAAGGA